jgi:hypothetical protein
MAVSVMLEQGKPASANKKSYSGNSVSRGKDRALRADASCRGPSPSTVLSEPSYLSSNHESTSVIDLQMPQARPKAVEWA